MTEKEKGTPEVLAGRTIFHWEGKQEWKGYDQDDLRRLVGIITTLIGIPPHQAEKISVVFGDHLIVQYSDGSTHLNHACCVGIFDPPDPTFLECLVVINRSLELARHCLKENQKKRANNIEKLQSLGVYDHARSAPPIYAVMKNPREAIIWLITEELMHARIYLTAQTNEVYENWLARYTQIMKSKGLKANHPFDIHLSEIAACRNVLRVLAILSEGKRSDYFRELYEKSLSTGQIVIRNHYEPNFVKTGFSEKKLALSQSIEKIGHFFVK